MQATQINLTHCYVITEWRFRGASMEILKDMILIRLITECLSYVLLTPGVKLFYYNQQLMSSI